MTNSAPATSPRRGRLLFIAIMLVAMVAAAIVGWNIGLPNDPAGPRPASVSSSAPAQPKSDPYETYLKLAPSDAPKISREDAQTRALLGCGQSWAPGTVDAALAEAYADLCKQR
ncbi:hypothetical protein E1211_15190 [Micromonospora sp. 15K316]|uniref:hypothetical protein n=1 Tax=unclassified Micromonospora TaxID=2617518 RepID=UPI00104ADEC7|nr:MULTISPECIES: hypothetical protein [unclassified Micromonospora]TDB71810.1 hypothetical protein E1165_22035 [Micromonospora sp. KC723]TDC35651.1 hypothetical protein E1211_15190 [Micromonospora sp. 15K316]